MKKNSALPYIILIIAIIPLSIYLGLNLATGKILQNLPLPTFPKGEHSYFLSYNENKTGPKVNKIIVNPTDPKTDQQQTITLEITSKDNPVDSVSIQIYKDKRDKDRDPQAYQLELIDGTNTDGTWSTTINIDAPYKSNYIIRHIVSDSLGSSTGDLHIN